MINVPNKSPWRFWLSVQIKKHIIMWFLLISERMAQITAQYKVQNMFLQRYSLLTINSTIFNLFYTRYVFFKVNYCNLFYLNVDFLRQCVTDKLRVTWSVFRLLICSVYAFLRISTKESVCVWISKWVISDLKSFSLKPSIPISILFVLELDGFFL